MSSKKTKNTDKKVENQTGTQQGGTSTGGQGQKVQGLVINGQYIKDLSFENPNPGNLFNKTALNPVYDVNIEIQSQQVGDSSYEVTLVFKITAKHESTMLYVLELQYSGVFSLPELPENLLKQFLLIQCPHLLFPFARHVISKVTAEGGFMPLQLTPMDFASLYKQNEGNIQTKSKTTGTK